MNYIFFVSLFFSFSLDEFGALPIVISAILRESAILTYKCAREHNDSYLCRSCQVPGVYSRSSPSPSRFITEVFGAPSHGETTTRLVLLAERLRVFRRDRGDLMRKCVRRDLAIFFFFYVIYMLQSHVSFLVIHFLYI